MAHLEVLTPHTIQDPDLRAMLLASGDEIAVPAKYEAECATSETHRWVALDAP